MPNVFQDGGPGRDADARAHQDGDFVVEHVLCGSTVRPVDANLGHLLPVLHGDFVHSQRIEAVDILGLFGPAAESVAECLGKVAYLPNVDTYVRVEGTGRNREGMPLHPRDVGDLDEKPLSCFVTHAWFFELDFHGVYVTLVVVVNLAAGSALSELAHTIRMPDNFCNFSFSCGTDLPIYPFEEIYATAKKLPSPAFVSNAVSPEIVTSKGRVRVGGVPHETPGGMGVKTKQERNEQVMRVPECLVRLLPDSVVGGSVHQQHAEKHDVSGDSTSLRVVDLDSGLRANLGLFNVEKTALFHI